jgi:hypothetical protein
VVGRRRFLRRLSGWYNLGLLGAYYIAWCGLFLPGSIRRTGEDLLPAVSPVWAVSFNVCMMAVLFAFSINYLRLLYLCWKAIQDGRATTTPGKAVGLLFVPLFNLYWMFTVYVAYARNYNAYLERYNIGIKRLPVGLFVGFYIFNVLQIVMRWGNKLFSELPFVGLVEVAGWGISVTSQFLSGIAYVLLFMSYNRLVATERHKQFMFYDRLRRTDPRAYRERMKALRLSGGKA